MPDITRVQELVYELAIKDVMHKDVITVPPETSMAQIREILREHRISGVPIMEGSQLVGIISTEDLIKALAMGEMSSTAADRMTRDPITLTAEEPVVLAVKHFERYGFGRSLSLTSKGNWSASSPAGMSSRGCSNG
jgi:predicted transcriptional regulator